MGNVFHYPTPSKPRFSLGPTRTGAVACLYFWAAASASAALAPAPAADPSLASASAYRQASESFNQEEYGRALDLLEHAPEAGKAGEQADVWNLRGAIYLHQRRFDKARDAFKKASEKDPGLWAARFNLAEVNFRQGKYAESSRQFEELLGKTSRWTHSDERGFLQYKLLLTQLLAGNEKPAHAYLEEHRGDHTPSLMYFYLNAALEHRHGHGRQAEQWLAQADAHYSPASEQVFAESFRSLDWDTPRTERLIAAARRHDASTSTPAALAVVELLADQSPAARAAESPAKNSAATALLTPPAASPKPTFRTTAAPAPAAAGPGEQETAEMPPRASDDRADLPQDEPVRPTPAAENVPPDPRAVYATPIVLGRPSNASSKPKGTPTASPSAAPSASPSASTAATDSPAPSPSASPAASPRADFVEKYEQAYVKFVEKSYPEARRLLDEADAIQPGQTTSINLRGQIFKHYYEAAYMAYKQRADYAGTINLLDEADATQPNQPDALNLRGLTYSKEKDYPKAEAAFKRAIQAEPQFWAARFNYAELPFNYQNYLAARTRFEELNAQTDASKQPREAELTQFKIFLTLLLEGKVDGARNFMQHLSFTGMTPARYFCQAALEFHDGNADKAQAEIEHANKEFQPRLVDIFKESFYRIGWLIDPNSPAAATATTAQPAASPALADAVPAMSPALIVAATPVPSVVPTPAASVAKTPVAASTPPLVAANSPLPTPAATARPVAPTPAATPAFARAADTPAPEPTPAAERYAKPSRNENFARLLLIGFVLITVVWNLMRLLVAAMNRKPSRPLPVTRSPLYASRPGAEDPDEVEAPR